MKKEDITVIEKLLEKLGDIKVNSANQSDFNVFTALGIETKEMFSTSYFNIEKIK